VHPSSWSQRGKRRTSPAWAYAAAFATQRASSDVFRCIVIDQPGFGRSHQPRFEEQLVAGWRRPGRLLHALAESVEVRANFGRGIRRARGIGGAGRAADDFSGAGLAAALV